MPDVWVINLQTVPYAQGLALQHRIVAARKRGELSDVLLLLEHFPVYTLGRNAQDSNLLASPEFLSELGIEIYRVERGGDVTYHGPNQLVGYPIINLRDYRQDVGWFVRSLEETLVRTLADFGIQGRLLDKLIGVWVDNPDGGTGALVSPDAKIVQIGARIEEWITYHGFALNVDPNMAHFDLIIPCGISDKAVTSMARVLKRSVNMQEVRRRVVARFGEVFGAQMIEIAPDDLAARLDQMAPDSQPAKLG